VGARLEICEELTKLTTTMSTRCRTQLAVQVSDLDPALLQRSIEQGAGLDARCCTKYLDDGCALWSWSVAH
jgi:hypothetical protein